MENHETLTHLVTSLVKSSNNCLIVHGDAGIGKSEHTVNALKALGYSNGIHYQYTNNYLAPRSFYDFLYANENNLQNPKIIILDDVEETLRENKSIGILKGAIWQVDGKRVCNWVSGNRLSSFEFTGKFIIIINEWNQDNAMLGTIKDRSMYYQMEFTQNQIGNLIKKRAFEKGYQDIPQSKRIEIAEHVISKVGVKKISLRDLKKAYDLYIASPNHYKELMQKIL